MVKEVRTCAWCNGELKRESRRPGDSPFCPDCHKTYETESHRPLHPVEVRQPHAD